MSNLSLRNLTCNGDLYRDAVTLLADKWVAEYGIHDDFAPLIRHYNVAQDGAHPFAHSEVMTPKLKQGVARLFLLGMQIASEEMGNGGRSPVPGLSLDHEEFLLESGESNPIQCGTELETSVTYLSRRLMEDFFRDTSRIRYEGHMPDRNFDPFQTFLILGIEEGLHAEFSKIPGNKEAFLADKKPDFVPSFDAYQQDAAEIYIHNDLLKITDKINPQYDRDEWELFIQTYDKEAARLRASLPKAEY